MPAGSASFDGTTFDASLSVQPFAGPFDPRDPTNSDPASFANVRLVSDIFALENSGRAIVFEWDFGPTLIDAPGNNFEEAQLEVRLVIGLAGSVVQALDYARIDAGGNPNLPSPPAPSGIAIVRLPGGLDALIETTVEAEFFDTSAEVTWCAVDAGVFLSPYDIQPPFQNVNVGDARALPGFVAIGDLNVDYAAPAGTTDFFDVLDGVANIQLGNVLTLPPLSSCP